jgi:hypothetical protein
MWGGESESLHWDYIAQLYSNLGGEEHDDGIVHLEYSEELISQRD